MIYYSKMIEVKTDEKKLEKEIAIKALDYLNTDNLFSLVDVFMASKKILSDNKFPIEKYKKWKNQ